MSGIVKWCMNKNLVDHMGLYFFRSFVEDAALEERNGYLSCSIHSMESSIIILNSFNGNFYFSNPAGGARGAGGAGGAGGARGAGGAAGAGGGQGGGKGTGGGRGKGGKWEF